MGETICAEYRGRAVGSVQSAWALGWGAAVLLQAVTFTLLPEELVWRAMFAMGFLPALLLVYIRRHIEEPVVAQVAREKLALDGDVSSILEIFKPAILKTTVLASVLTMGAQGGYYAIMTWIPTFLKTERKLTVIGSTGYLAFVIASSFADFLFGAWMTNRYGRRKLFISFSVCAIVLVLAYTQLEITNEMMMWLGFPLGFSPAVISPDWALF